MIFGAVIGKFMAMLSTKTFFLLFLLFFVSSGYSQPHVNNQKADLLRAAAERKKSIEELSARLAAFQIKLSTANLGGDALRQRGQPPDFRLEPFMVGSKGFPVKSRYPTARTHFRKGNQLQSPSAPNCPPILISKRVPEAPPTPRGKVFTSCLLSLCRAQVTWSGILLRFSEKSL